MMDVWVWLWKFIFMSVFFWIHIEIICRIGSIIAGLVQVKACRSYDIVVRLSLPCHKSKYLKRSCPSYQASAMISDRLIVSSSRDMCRRGQDLTRYRRSDLCSLKVKRKGSFIFFLLLLSGVWYRKTYGPVRTLVNFV